MNNSKLINWKVRFRNKTFLLTFLPFLISTVYQFVAASRFTARADQAQITDIVVQFINILGLLGIVVDGTTKGITDRHGKIDWNKRFHNQAFLMSFFPALISFTYQVISIAGVVPRIEENSLLDNATQLINVLVLAGIVSDGTTPGFNDSKRALGYEDPQ